MSVGFVSEKTISQQQHSETGRASEIKELSQNPMNIGRSRTLEEIVQTTNKIIDEKLSDSSCSKTQIDMLKQFAHKRLKSTDINQLNNSYDLVIRNLEIATEKFKKAAPQCRNKTLFERKMGTSQEASSINNFFKDLWPFS
jgi:hypothetical protein